MKFTTTIVDTKANTIKRITQDFDEFHFGGDYLPTKRKEFLEKVNYWNRLASIQLPNDSGLVYLYNLAN